ncbi:cytoplasmic phosphatidylinositol transfer protein 1-like isoform X2 [Pogoniulus pusillus]|uniref:cytoplasmic phosphatidylinositol transfer protein 1-like isoform X2 n=1 Tax=Pogoniulus pusillus TaxID=488313 RepID=UPI0030B957D3
MCSVWVSLWLGAPWGGGPLGLDISWEGVTLESGIPRGSVPFRVGIPYSRCPWGWITCRGGIPVGGSGQPVGVCVPVGGDGHPCGWVCPGLGVPGEEHPSGPADGPSLQCSFLPKFSIYIETKYEDNCGDSENIFHSEKILGDHEVSFLDIAFDEIPERYYRSLEDPRFFSSAKTGRGPLREGWRQHTKPIMCSYKLVSVKFEVWGLQTRVEQFVHKVIRDILLIGHRQAFAWVDEWCDMSLEEVRAFETQMQVATNQKLGSQTP